MVKVEINPKPEYPLRTLRFRVNFNFDLSPKANSGKFVA